MATAYKKWAASTTLLNAASITTGTASVAVDLATLGYEGAHVTVLADFPATPTDHLDVEVQASIDGTNWDVTPLAAIRLDKASDPNQASFIIRDVAHFRLYCKRSGSTDTITVTVKARPWRYGRSPV